VWAGLALVALAVFSPQLRRNAAPAPGEEDIVAAAPLGGAPLGPAAVSAAGQPSAWRNPWGSALAWQVTLFMGLQSTTYYVLVTWMPSIERAGGVPASAAGFHLLIFNALGIAGSLSAAVLMPQLRGPRLIVTVGPVMILVAVLGLLAAPLLGVLWACFAGVGAGATIVLALSLFGLRTRHHRQAASLSGMAQSIGYLLAAAGPVAMGAIHDATGRWAPTLVILGAVCVLQIVFGLLATRPRFLG
jgi:CP family cyanate transporter-like MFS transporter